MCSIHEIWIGDPEPDTGSVSKRTTESIFTIRKKYLLHWRYPKTGSPNQIQSQKFVPILVRPSLYLDTAQPWLGVICTQRFWFFGPPPHLSKKNLVINRFRWRSLNQSSTITVKCIFQRRLITWATKNVSVLSDPGGEIPDYKLTHLIINEVSMHFVWHVAACPEFKMFKSIKPLPRPWLRYFSEINQFVLTTNQWQIVMWNSNYETN